MLLLQFDNIKSFIDDTPGFNLLLSEKWFCLYADTSIDEKIYLILNKNEHDYFTSFFKYIVIL